MSTDLMHEDAWLQEWRELELASRSASSASSSSLASANSGRKRRRVSSTEASTAACAAHCIKKSAHEPCLFPGDSGTAGCCCLSLPFDQTKMLHKQFILIILTHVPAHAHTAQTTWALNKLTRSLGVIGEAFRMNLQLSDLWHDLIMFKRLNPIFFAAHPVLFGEWFRRAWWLISLTDYPQKMCLASLQFISS